MQEKILVVDDELSVRELLYDALTKAGYRVISTHNGKEAIELARTQKPHLVLLDFKLSDTDGIEVFKNISGFDRKTRVVMLTGLGTEELERQARLAGAAGFLSLLPQAEKKPWKNSETKDRC